MDQNINLNCSVIQGDIVNGSMLEVALCSASIDVTLKWGEARHKLGSIHTAPPWHLKQIFKRGYVLTSLLILPNRTFVSQG